MGKNVLITGGTGLIGKKLYQSLKETGNDVAVLSRNPGKTKMKAFYGDYEKNEIDQDAINFADIVINLAGENISEGRWTKKQKKKIIDSRVKTVELLWTRFKEKKLEAFISASAIGFYGSYTSEKIFTEDMPSGNDFLAETVDLWEQAVDKFQSFGVRTVKLRIGVVLAKEGGAFPKLLKNVKLGIGSAVGSGNQYMPWIHIEDLIRLFNYTIENQKNKGVYNATSPSFKTNYEFMKQLSEINNKPFFMPKIPSFLIRLMLGEMSCIILNGSRVSSTKIIESGFTFKYKDLNKAFSELIND